MSEVKFAGCHMDRVAKLESLQEIIAEMSGDDETSLDSTQMTLLRPQMAKMMVAAANLLLGVVEPQFNLLSSAE